MKYFFRIQVLALVSLSALALFPSIVHSQSALIPTPPAFLDSSDKITAWIPFSVPSGAYAGKAVVDENGVPLAISSVTATEQALSAAADKSHMVVVAGTIQHLFGGSDWSPGDTSTQMTEISPDVYEFVGSLPSGHYEYKIAVGGSWTVNYGKNSVPGGDNIGLDIPHDKTIVRFVANLKTNTIADSINDPDQISAPTSVPKRQAPEQTFDMLEIDLAKPLNRNDLSKNLSVSIDQGPARTIYCRDVLDSYPYTGTDLGSNYSEKQTTFKTWSPCSSKVDLLIGQDGVIQTIPMTYSADNSWSVTVPGDLRGTDYDYEFHSYGESRVAPDIYCRAATQDGKWSVVLNWDKTNPKTLDSPRPISPATNAVVYEASIRDLTSDPSSGVKNDWRGKYLGLTQTGTICGSLPTGIDYLKWLGVDAVQIMPFQMFNPEHHGDYNWGYETYLFDAPESQYSTHPDDPIETVAEARTMIQSLHSAGISVIMDVVYNHSVPKDGPDSPFWQAAPYYYFRTDSQGNVLDESGVGNALDDDHVMVRKYIQDSLCYWASAYNIDGFRFDLLGMFEPSSVAQWRAALDTIRPGIIMYGEPWTGGGPTRFGKGAQKGMGVGVFNDNYRNAIRGDLDGTEPGFAMGSGDSAAVKRGLEGSIDDFTQEPSESVNYASCHDDMCLWDKIQKSMPNASLATQKDALKLSGAMVLLAEGMPFLEGGAEIGRTKGGNSNSYDAGDSVNHFDWKRAADFEDVAQYYRGLIALRKANPDIRLSDANQIRQDVVFLPTTTPNTVEYEINNRTLVFLHGSLITDNVTLPSGNWHLVVDGDHSGTETLSTANGGISLSPLSATVLER